jgi:hypothetical protein
MSAHIEALRVRMEAALDELFRIQQSDDFAYTSGAYAQALGVLADATKALKAAEESQETAPAGWNDGSNVR